MVTIIDVIIRLIERGEPPAEIFATMKSAGRNEAASAGVNGHKAGCVFEIFNAEFSNQEELEYNGNRLSIYRTFIKANGDKIELYTEERVGKGQ